MNQTQKTPRVIKQYSYIGYESISSNQTVEVIRDSPASFPCQSFLAVTLTSLWRSTKIKMNKEWLKTNLDEAIFWIENAKKEIDTLEESDDLIAQQLVSEAYIKLNYAWNSRGGLDSEGKNYDEFIKYPKEMNIFTDKKSTIEAFKEMMQPTKRSNS